VIDRRTTIKWVLAAGVASQMPAFGIRATEASVGYGKDPDLAKTYAAGDLWPLTLTDAQLRTANVLCELIVPAASAVAVPRFIDEWISAPYPGCKPDREIIVQGLGWLDTEAHRRFQQDFAPLTADQARLICDDICNRSQAKTQFASAALFFERFRELTAVGYYTTPLGAKELGYVGNVPLTSFEGPPLEVLKRAGLA
jgi:hypothetical protein